MLTIAIISQKGGAGKTTISVGLAVAHQLAGSVAAVVDLDPQGSASVWNDLREADQPVVVSAHAPRIERVLDAARGRGVGLVVVDTAPHASDAALAAARVADLVLIPCRASVADLHAIGSSLDVCRVAAVPAYVVLNAVPVQGRLADQARAAMAEHGAAVAPVMLCQRIAHVHAFTAGLSAMEYQVQSKAAAEIAALYRWAIDQGGNHQ
jgi:chromosome partitioning protein